jgi:polyhydroxyalkanoate synthesis regulator phasin
MRKFFLMLVLLAVAAGAGYVTGYKHAQEGVDAVTLAHSLEQTAVYGQLLQAMPDRADSVTGALDQRLRAAVDSAERQVASSPDIDVDIPSIMDGLRRAKAYAEKKGDVDLERRVRELEEKIRRKLK